MGNITFLGVEGSGKTVLTMALVNLFKAHEAEGWFLRPETRSAFRFVEQVPPVLEPGSLPHQTTALRHLAMSVVKDGEVQRVFDILDYPGEIYRLAFLDAKDDPDPATFQARVEANQEDIRTLLSHLQGSDRVYVLFNLADAQDLAHNAKNLDAVWVTNACLDYLHQPPQLPPSPPSRPLREYLCKAWSLLELPPPTDSHPLLASLYKALGLSRQTPPPPSRPEIALLLTQIDLYGDLNDPTLSPRRIAQQVLPLITRNFPNLSIQAVSALGPASGPFGVDKIVAECLRDTAIVRVYNDFSTSPEMQHFLQAAQAFTGEVKDAKELEAVYRKADTAYQHVLAILQRFQAESIWFCKATNVTYAQELGRDWEAIAGLYRQSPEIFRGEHSRALSSLELKTEVGKMWLHACCERNRAFREEKVASAGCLGGVIGGVLGLALWIVILNWLNTNGNYTATARWLLCGLPLSLLILGACLCSTIAEDS